MSGTKKVGQSLLIQNRLLHPRISRHPVDLPSLAAVVREGLLEADRVGVERRDQETDEDGASVEVFLVV